MQAAGFIERIRNPADERQVFAELTERGKSLEDRAARAVGLRRQLRGVGRDKRRVLSEDEELQPSLQTGASP